MLGGYSVSQALPYSYSRAQPCVQWMEYSAIWSEYDAISWNVPIHHFDMYCRCFKPSKLSGRSQSTSAWSNIILVGTRLLSCRRRRGVSWHFPAGLVGWLPSPIAARFERWTTQFKDTNNRVLMLPREWRNVRLCFASGKILRWSNKNLVRCRIACLEEHFKAQWEEWKWQAAFVSQSTCSQPFASNGIRSFNVEKSNFT